MNTPIWSISNPWTYFFKIERDILEISEYITFNNNNEICYGERVSSLIILIGSELDTNLRVMTGNEPKSNMRSWKRWLKEWNQNIIDVSIDNKFNFRNSVTPYPHLESAAGYEWWDSYNSIKHNRYESADKANIGTLMELVSALFCVNAYASYRIPIYYQDMFRSRLFEISMLWDIIDPNNIDHSPKALKREDYLKHIYSSDPQFPTERYFNLNLPLIKGHHFGSGIYP